MSAVTYPDPAQLDKAALVAEVSGLPIETAALVAQAGLRSLLAEPETDRYMAPRHRRRLMLAFELGQRIAQEPQAERAVFRTPTDAGRYLLPIYSTRPVETFGVLTLNVRRQLICERVVSTGCLTSSLVHPREVFNIAVKDRAAAIVLFHNHPSGDPEPSAEDVSLTRRLVQAGQLMGIEVIDHIVLGAGRFVSLKERGAL